MAKLKAKISGDEYESLQDTLKEFYAETADGWALDAEGVEDVSGLKTALEKERKERRDAKAELSKYEGLDADEARRALEETKKLDEKKLIDKQKFDEVLAKYRKEFDEKLAAEQQRNAQLLTNLKREKLTNLLVDKGVLPDRARFAVSEVGEKVEIVSDENGITLKRRDGIGDAKELDELVSGLKQTSAFLFAPQNASGSGAVPSISNTGSGFGQKIEPGQARIAHALATALPNGNSTTT